MSSPDPALDDDDRAALEAVVADDETVAEVLQDVGDVLHGLADMDVDVTEPADLERIRQALPSDPARAQIIHTALPIPLREALEYVHPSDRQAGYWRRSRDRSTPERLSDAELRKNLAFARAGMAQRGTTGTVETSDGRRIPAAAARIGAEVRGQDFTDDDPTDAERRKGEGLLGRILDRL